MWVGSSVILLPDGPDLLRWDLRSGFWVPKLWEDIVLFDEADGRRLWTVGDMASVWASGGASTVSLARGRHGVCGISGWSDRGGRWCIHASAPDFVSLKGNGPKLQGERKKTETWTIMWTWGLGELGRRGI